MPKIKTRSSAKKRFKKTGTGKIIMAKASHNHLLLQKSKKQKRLTKKGIQATTQLDTIKKMVPYL